MNPLTQYKLLIEVAVIGALIAVLAWGVHLFLQHEQQIGYDRATAEYTKQALLSEQAARAKEQMLTKQLEDAQNAATLRDQQIQALTAATRASSDGLRNVLGTIRDRVPTASVDALRAATITLSGVLGDCQDKYRGMAEVADRHASDVKTLTEAWPTKH